MINSLLNKVVKRQASAPTIKKTYGNPAKNISCTEPEVDNWVTSDFVVNKLVPVVGWHPFPLTELMLMTATVTRFRPKAIFEWGTHIGKSARVFYEIIEAFNIPSHVYSFDLPDDIEHNEHPHETRGMLVKGLRKVTLFQEDGVSGALKVSRKKKLASKDMLFFIDGDHSYESVTRELSAVIKNHPEAKILLHDTFYQSSGSKYNIGPWKAVDEFLRKNKSYKSMSTTTGLPGMTLVYKGK